MKLRRYNPTIGHKFMRTDAVMVPAPKGDYVDYEEAQRAIEKLEAKVQKLTRAREQQNG